MSPKQFGHLSRSPAHFEFKVSKSFSLKIPFSTLSLKCYSSLVFSVHWKWKVLLCFKHSCVTLGMVWLWGSLCLCIRVWYRACEAHLYPHTMIQYRYTKCALALNLLLDVRPKGHLCEELGPHSAGVDTEAFVGLKCRGHCPL